MTNSQMMISLLRTLKVEMNGAVVEAMEQRGLHYALNYGVALPTIKSISAEYAPNHSLAKLLYRQDVRELRIAALYIAQPSLMTTDDADFWGNGIVSSEIAEILAMTMLSKSCDAENIITAWLTSDSVWMQYAALMGAARCVTKAWSTNNMRSIAERFAQSTDLFLRRGAELLNDRLTMLSEIVPE